MAFSMSGPAASNAQARQAADLDEISTELLGFSALGGAKKLKLLPTPWPADALPPSTSSLLAVASQKGLLAAAGPESLVVASTDAVRAALHSKDQAQDGIINFEPQLTIPGPRLSQVAFTSDDQHLVLSAESGGGLAIHDVAALLNGKTESTFQLATEGMAVRSLNPNPAPEHAEFIAVVLTGGQLMLANLKERSFVKPNNNAVLKSGVSCVSWSNKGKQMIAGLGDGTAFQLKPDGSAQAVVPRPPQLEGDQHVSAIFWLANDDFLIVHTPTQFEADTAPDSTFHFVHRDKGSQNYSFQKLVDPAPPFGLNRSPPHHFMARLRNWKPSMDDMLMISSTAGVDVGVVTRSSVPLSSDQPITNVYTTTSIGVDSRRAQMPSSIGEDVMDTSPIGLAIDLSSKDKVWKPIQGSDVEWSPTPLPQLVVLNNEGFLVSWWVVYNASIEQNTGYDGLVTVGGGQAAQQAQPAAPTPFGGRSSTSGAAPAFGSSGFGASGTSAFGSSSALGGSKSPWQSASTGSAGGAPAFGKQSFGTPSAPGAFGQPAFGSASKPGATFGAPGGLGSKGSVWGAPSTATSQLTKPSSPFGGTAAAQSPFATLAQNTNNTAGGGFSAFGKPSTASPFANAQNKPGQSAFGNPAFGSNNAPTQSFGGSSAPSFASTVSLNSSVGGSTVKSFGAPQNTNLFGQKAAQPQTEESEMADTDDPRSPKGAQKSNIFGDFKLGTTFAKDGTSNDDLPKPANPSGSFGLGQSFGQVLDAAQNESTGPKPPTKPENPFGQTQSLGQVLETANKESSGPNPSAKPENPFAQASSKPEITSPTPAAKTPNTSGSLFDNLGKQGKSGSSLFGNIGNKPATNGAAPTLNPEKPKPKSPSPQPKEEDAPLPPDFTAPKPKKSQDSKAEDAPEDAPLPPDFTKKAKEPESKDTDDLPPIAGSPPVEVEKPESPSPSENSADKEGASSPTAAPLPPDLRKPANAFSFPSAPDTTKPSAPPKPPSPSRSPTRPAARVDFGASTTPFGAPKTQPPVPVFPPNKNEDTLRSPSPVRTASASVPATGPRREAMKIPPAPPVTRATSRPAAPEPDSILQDLPDDEEAEQTRNTLASSPTATKTLKEFYVHQDYAGPSGPTSIAGSIEQLYRDMQSMVDTVGLNAHHLAGFIKGHMENEGQERQRSDLEVDVDDPDAEGSWCLAEIDDLEIVENNLENSLDRGRLSDVQGKIRDLIRLSKDVSQLRKRLQDVRKAIEARKDPAKLAQTRGTPLSEEQSAQQLTLRGSFADTQKLLTAAEEAIVLLKTRMSSAEANRGSPNTPTAEAVEKTIAKMTAMIEKKSGDLDVLETQMRKLRLLGNSGYGFDYDEEEDDDIAAGLTSLNLRSSLGPRSREGSPAFATPPTTRTKMLNYGTPGTGRSNRSSRGYGLFYTPDGKSSPAPFRSSFNGSMTGPIPASSLGEEITKEDVRTYKAKQAKRSIVAEKLREAAARRGGPRVTKIGP
ncbi:uncharacterized protein K452DRAFT_144834 [Aplosporella prunicola CBS 121167]|uniref:Nucleoporin Nup159/Nup146 N-terminal domain-containing protein n=1 Tax=Aplosporella prunicola CBS 121167 TaxID=1176127 RepID=A0A6A6BPY1_9PEZI|nr:uncharacterized protein K452DRAFT_144834 [Aplosporella prunicola CBS 121167]KAF2144631.1 hypothetical protein K452DRAFT_144834 [Aplosporella prunicola CBS 121167]